MNNVKKIYYVVFSIFLVWGFVYSQQQSVTASAEANIRAVTIFVIDGTDAGWGRSSSEIIEIGVVDAIGSRISGVPIGNPDINGISGIPVNAYGSPVPSYTDPNCIGAFYPILSATGGNSGAHHPNSALSVFLLTFSRWRISVNAQLINSSPGVSVNQLKWKFDGTSANGFQGYKDFTSSEKEVASGSGAWHFFYIDYGLVVEHEDGPGLNTWLITYTLITD